MILVWWAWTGLTWLGRKQVARFCERGNERCGVHIRTLTFRVQENTNKCTILQYSFYK
jgi:hypothetical protein